MPLLSLNLDSPVEFVIIGPKAGKDIVLVRSRGSGVDLTGFASSQKKAKKSPFNIIRTFFFRRRIFRMNCVESNPVREKEGVRKSAIRFAWVGDCSSRAFEEISEEFKIRAADLVNSETEEEREAHVAALIYMCSLEQTRISNRKRMVVMFALLYTAMFAYLFFIKKIRM